MTLLDRIKTHVQFSLAMTRAYLAYHRDDMITCVNQEMRAYELERRLIADALVRRFV